MNYLFLFTITPVQSFISQSRKLKDLFGSSDILSCMSEIGLMICKREGAKEIFPIQNKQKAYPNRFLVEFENKSVEEIKNIAQDIEENLLKFLRGLNDKNHPIIQKHIENYFSFYWAISEIKDNYQTAFKEIEKKLAGAKNTKFFNQLEEIGRKCSICGERNVVVYNGKLPMIKEQIEDDRPIKDKIAQNGEGLCGVCYVKRRYAHNEKKESFDSTADVALSHIFEKIDKKEFNLLSKNSQLFFKENLNETYLKEQGLLEDNKLSDYIEEWKRFYEAVKEKELKQTSYYGVIMFDGDSMGEWLSGKNLESGNLKEFHKFMSERLSVFANESFNLVKHPRGESVYAGGDDFLGFVNINYLFDVLIDLKNKWEEVVNEPLQEKFNLKKDFTFSAGVVVAHYKTPLAYVLNKLRESEKSAKNFRDKDAVSFTVLKRSGEIRQGNIKFDKLNLFAELYKRLKKESDSFISKLEKEFVLFLTQENNLALKKLVKAELRRLLSKSDIKDERLVDDLMSLYTDFGNFSHLLNFIKFINRETK